ncbi:MAG: 4Fe-4S binding protein [Clostridia bacterium]
MEKRALRNIKLCTKDCLCLYVCPTGATNTENGQIDSSKCIGCGACAESCKSHAISMVPYKYPKQQEKQAQMCEKMRKIAISKIDNKNILNNMVNREENKNVKKLFKAILLSNKIMAQELMRESGYLLPQSNNTIELLKRLSEDDNLDKEKLSEIKELIKLLKSSRKGDEKYEI